jgi:hypothetical protein
MPPRVRASYFLKRRASAASPLGNARATLTATSLSDGVPLAERNVVPGDVAGLLRQVAVAHGIDGVVIRSRGRSSTAASWAGADPR